MRFIDISEVHTVAAIALKKNEHSFGIVTSKRQYYVRASNAKEMQEWIDALNDAKEQMRQRSTITREMAGMEVGNGGGGGGGISGGEEVPRGSPRPRGSSISPNLAPVDRRNSFKGNTSNTSPINIIIPGKGLYTSPAQARQSSVGTGIVSPLTATSDSEQGHPTGAEQFGLSYASSAGHSLASSPGRGGFIQHQQPYDPNSSGGGRQSPHSHSGGDEGLENATRTIPSSKSNSGLRDTSVGSSGGEAGSSGMRTGWTPAAPAVGRRASNSGSQQQQAAVLSSSDEDGEGEEWDEDEVADQAMPLPGSSGIVSTHSGIVNAAFTNVTSPSSNAPSGKPKVDSDFLKGSNKIIHQGYLMKQSNRRKHWRKRWFVLTSANLSYTRSHMNEKPHRQIPLTSILDAIEYTSKKEQSTSNNQVQPLQSTNSSLHSPPPPVSFQLGSNQENINGLVASSRDVITPAGETEPTHERKTNSLASPTQTTPGPPKKKKENCFKIITPKRTYVVCAPTEEEEMKWLSALQALLAHWRGSKEADTETPTGTNNAAVQPQSSTLAASTTSTPKPVRRGDTTEDIGIQD